jgi:hypothetical protein
VDPTWLVTLEWSHRLLSTLTEAQAILTVYGPKREANEIGKYFYIN